MEWDHKSSLQWDWENLALFADKPIQSEKDSAQQHECRFFGGEKISSESMHSSPGTVSSNQEFGCSPLSRMEINLEAYGGWNKKAMNNAGSSSRSDETDRSSSSAPAAGLGEPLIGLKLGKRTYFENVCGAAPAKGSATSSAPPAIPLKKKRFSKQDLQIPLCQVEGCSIDLTTAKDYHRKHRVCEVHTKSPQVVVAGVERRFCQQCSRFHGLSEFDQKKRSCRRRLSDHNARRRKPPPENFSFGSTRFSALAIDFRQQTGLLFGQSPYFQVWDNKSPSESFGGFNFAENKCFWGKPRRSPVNNLLHSTHGTLPSLPACNRDAVEPLSFNQGSAAPPEIHQDVGASVVAAPCPTGAPELRRALSLLSIGSWGPPEPQPASLPHFANAAAPLPSPMGFHSSWANSEAPFTQQAPCSLSTLDYLSSGGNGGGDIPDFQLARDAYETSYEFGHLHCE